MQGTITPLLIEVLPQTVSDYAGINRFPLHLHSLTFLYWVNSALYYEDDTCPLSYSDSLKFKAASALTEETYSVAFAMKLFTSGAHHLNTCDLLGKKIYHK